MKLSSRSRYGTRLMLDLAMHYDHGPIPVGEISRRQDISVKYLEQLIIPLKKAKLIKSVRGPKGGYMLSKDPARITVGEIVEVLEGGVELSKCLREPERCERVEVCKTRKIWEEATEAVYERLNSITLAELIKDSTPADFEAPPRAKCS